MTQVGTNQPKEVWCQAKSSDNHGGEKWQTCQKCCSFCDDNNCPIRVCHLTKQDNLCCWRASPAEWLMGRIQEEARQFIYKRRQREYWLKEGHRPNDGSWEGEKLAEWWLKYPKVYQEMLAEVYGIEEEVHEEEGK